jgi:quercetin dioxygenase-like cupin family protein
MSHFSNVNEVEVLKIWNGVHGRPAIGDKAALVHLVLDPDAVVPEHRHPHEQTGILLGGSLRFTVGGETKELAPGDMWVIPGDTPHDVVAGPDGATLVELFAPPRDDWAGVERLPASPVTLPRA